MLRGSRFSGSSLYTLDVSGQGTFPTLQTNHSPQFFDNFAAEKENMQVETHSWWADDEAILAAATRDALSSTGEGAELMDLDMDAKKPLAGLLSLSDEPEEQQSMFTNSGNGFVFDNLASGPPRKVIHKFDSEDEAELAAIPADRVDNNDDRSGATTPEATLPENGKRSLDKPSVTAFINSFQQEGRAMPSAIINLHAMLLAHPDLVYLDRMEDGAIEVHFHRDQLIKALRQEEEKFPALVFTSFERGLKHAGMEVTQSTHGQITVKKWAMKKGFVPKPLGAKRPRKRKDQGDEDYDEKKKPRYANNKRSSTV